MLWCRPCNVHTSSYTYSERLVSQSVHLPSEKNPLRSSVFTELTAMSSVSGELCTSVAATGIMVGLLVGLRVGVLTGAWDQVGSAVGRAVRFGNSITYKGSMLANVYENMTDPLTQTTGLFLGGK